MDNPLFSQIISDCYTRCYKLNPAQFGDMTVTVYALCTENVERINDDYYWLDIYYSIDRIATLDYLIGVSFGKGQLDQKSVDNEIDNMVQYTVTDPGFPLILQDYLKREKIIQDELNREALGGTGTLDGDSK